MTAAEVETLAKMAYFAHSRLGDAPWESLKSLEQERWRMVVRAVARALLTGHGQ